MATVYASCFHSARTRERFIRLVQLLLAAGGQMPRRQVIRRMNVPRTGIGYILDQFEQTGILLWEDEGEIGLLNTDDARRRLAELVAETKTTEAKAS